jgi:hypothetical protein
MGLSPLLKGARLSAGDLLNCGDDRRNIELTVGKEAEDCLNEVASRGSHRQTGIV